MYPSGSAPARIYGTPKMHKFSSTDTFPKLCPIVLSLGTFNYDLARFFCDLPLPVVSNDYSCKHTFSFVSQIKNVNPFCYITDLVFFFNSIFYINIDGVAMGSPLAPAFADIFTGFYEFKWLNEFNLHKTKFYL